MRLAVRFLHLAGTRCELQSRPGIEETHNSRASQKAYHILWWHKRRGRLHGLSWVLEGRLLDRFSFVDVCVWFCYLLNAWTLMPICTKLKQLFFCESVHLYTDWSRRSPCNELPWICRRDCGGHRIPPESPRAWLQVHEWTGFPPWYECLNISLLECLRTII